jgi:CDP-diacylglycerol--glycerol-3-phosphate 3-phosphatidyltransferase
MKPWQKNLPHLLTMSRMVFAIPIALIMNHDELWVRLVAAFLFAVASMTDYWDGYYARKWNLISDWGKIMDPIADKILVTTILVMFIPAGKIETWIVIILVARDLLIGGVRSVAAAEQMIISANPGGKWKTALQMIAIPAVMIGDQFLGVPFQTLGQYMLWVSTLLSLYSGAQYAWAYERARGRFGKTSKRSNPG